MKNLLTLVLIGVVGLSCVSTKVFADATKGKKIFFKKLKKSCGFNGLIIASKNTQKEWKKVQDAGKLNYELSAICPNVKPLKEKDIPHVYDFLYKNASDGENYGSKN